MVTVDAQHGGNKMTLIDVISNLDDFDSDDTIYINRPWKPDSEAIVATEPDIGGSPLSAKEIHAEYFLEVFIAIEFLEGVAQKIDRKASMEEQCLHLIKYAENDA